jgi:hypothetical protein
MKKTLLILVCLGVAVGCGNSKEAENPAEKKTNARKCLGNLQQLSRALIMHSGDNGNFPNANNWSDVIWANEEDRPSKMIFVSPRMRHRSTQEEAKNGENTSSYSYNNAASGMSSGDRAQVDIVLLFESTAGWNSSGGLRDALDYFESLPPGESMSICLGDGSTKLVGSKTELESLRWTR